ncbi:MAG: biotin--[acetyl-CoA-carboxylase] ligase, partial [Pseudomonadota bacterium]
TQLKWPNDIFLDGKKCGGILTESSTMPEKNDERFAVIGIGMNLGSSLKDFPEELQDKVTSLLIETGTCPDASQVFLAIRDELLQLLDHFCNFGFHPILEAWKCRDFLLGKDMECVGFDGKIIAGVSLGPDVEGQLHIRDVDGHIHTVLTGDIRLAGRVIKNG